MADDIEFGFEFDLNEAAGLWYGTLTIVMYRQWITNNKGVGTYCP